MNFVQTLQACDKQQQNIFFEIMESFNTFIEEILLARHVLVGATDTVNVQELLYRDFLELFRHLKMGPEEHERKYLDKLKTVKENRLGGIHKKMTMFRSNTQITPEQIINVKMTEKEREDIIEFLAMATNILQGVMSTRPGDQTLMDILKNLGTHRMTFDYRNEIIEVDEINKRSLGKMIIRYVGHEGSEEKPGLRRLLQACIDFLQKEGSGVWKNASFTIYDEDDNMYKIASGTRKYQFICRMKNGEPFIKEQMGGHSHKKPKTQHQQNPAQPGTQDKGCQIM
ncbi:uncharacterized protein LOC134258662 isoform X1 [Saccostrea cucullata]|uniref:uncharacterized protein LOC134258662 isoform X1 n=1 Tax=Saccostrea cuccullata TaxID=36930 RepID=UPI002ED19F6C